MSAAYSIVYISSMTHSGSTLLDSIIGSHNNAFGIGEAHVFRSYANLLRTQSQKTLLGNQCTCGAPTIWECEFWKKVDEELQERDQRTLRDLDIAAPDPTIFAQDNKLFFDAVAKVSSARIIVDSSKTIKRYQRLRESGFAEIIPIHLIRNPKGQVYSIMKRNNTGEFRPALRYSLDTIGRIIALRNQRPIKICYENLVGDPESSMKGLMREIGLEFEPRQLDWAKVERHNIGGNVKRVVRDSAIRLDDEWQQELTRRQIILINLITCPVKYLALLY